MKIATWNVNSIKVRLPRLLAMLQRHQPDVVCLQEIKTVAEGFPFDALQQGGYTSVANGQAAYNGVAILSRAPLTKVQHGFADPYFDSQARIISAQVGSIRVVCVYVPNGQSIDSDKYAYKLQWLARLRQHLQDLMGAAPIILCGDLNMAPRAEDVAQPDKWAQTVLFHPQMRQQFAELLACGLTDVGAEQHRQGGLYSWWNYRHLAFVKNDGLRIDHVLASSQLARRCSHVDFDRNERKGAQPSDHVPVLATFDLTG